jgi:hypothetical protein
MRPERAFRRQVRVAALLLGAVLLAPAAHRQPGAPVGLPAAHLLKEVAEAAALQLRARLRAHARQRQADGVDSGASARGCL